MEAAAVAPAWCWATGLRVAMLLLIQKTGHQMKELQAVQSVVQTQEAYKALVTPKPWGVGAMTRAEVKCGEPVEL